MNKCRHCQSELTFKFLDLGSSPPSNEYILKENLDKPEKSYPLQVYVCSNCWLVQTKDFTSGEDLFKDDYSYLSSTSSSWLEHSKEYTEKIIDLLNLNKDSFIVELASNDGYLLQNFLKKNIKCIGIEPTRGTAQIAIEKGIETIIKFFGEQTAIDVIKEYQMADLIIGNNVYAHVPDINDFTKGMKLLLSDNGVITLEFPSLVSLIDHKQFDTVYHEHFSYLSLSSVKKIFEKQGLRIWKVENLSTHGGSLRVYGCHSECKRKEHHSVSAQLNLEEKAGLLNIQTYNGFQKSCEDIKSNFINFLNKAKADNKKVVGYGAAAKGNTLINFSGIDRSLIKYVCDAATFKQNKYLPGSKIPILDPSMIEKDPPDFIIIFPWNLAMEIKSYLSDKIKPNCKIVTFIPELKTW